MSTDFLSLLNETNSIKNDLTGEIIITVPIIEAEEKLSINISCIITSNCNTVIKSDGFEILSSSVSLSNFSFQSKVAIQDSSNVSIFNSKIKYSKLSYGAVTVFNSKDVSLSHIEITETVDIPGIFICKNCEVNCDNLLIHNLTKSFIAVNSGSMITIKDSTFHHTKGNAIYLAGQSYIEIINSVFSFTFYPSLFVKDSKFVIKNSAFQNSPTNAISIYSSKEFLIENNTFSDIKDTAIQILEKSNGIVKDNKIFNVEGNGVYCHNSFVDIQNNEISNLTFPAIAISSRCKASLFGNKIANIKYSGICVRHAKEVKIVESEIEEINESGISISDTESCFIENNKISKCQITGIEAYNRSNVFVNNNIISHMKNHAFLVYTNGYMKAESNTINDVKSEVIKMSYKGGGDFIKNKISNCLKQCDCINSSFYYLFENGDFKNVTNDPSKISSENMIDFDDCSSNIDNKKELLCIKCNQKRRNCYLFQCGHKIYCHECAEFALKNKENCPLCRFPIVKVSTRFHNDIDDDSCIICCENKPNCIVLPCGHTCICSLCLENWFNTSQSCPICRTKPCIFKLINEDI